MKILAFSSSNSRKSINRQFAAHVAARIPSAEVELLDIHDYELPLFSIDREHELGQPELAKAFLHKISAADALVISHAEHNGSYTAAYKNLFDWVSRIERKVFADKPTLLLATSPGPGGAANVLVQAIASAPHFGAKVMGTVSLPSFHDNFDADTNTVSHEETNKAIGVAIEALEKCFS